MMSTETMHGKNISEIVLEMLELFCNWTSIRAISAVKLVLVASIKKAEKIKNEFN